MSELSLGKILEFLAASADEESLQPDTNDPGDIPFRLLGYDSLAVLRTVGYIERTYRIELPETVIGAVQTPRQLLDRVNAELNRAQSSTVR